MLQNQTVFDLSFNFNELFKCVQRKALLEHHRSKHSSMQWLMLSWAWFVWVALVTLLRRHSYGTKFMVLMVETFVSTGLH
jgi:hypothetical protein